MIISFSGHRSQKIGGFVLPNPTYISICKQTAAILQELKPEKCISGGALGYDQYSAFVCLKLGIPYDLAIPFEGFEKRWTEQSKRAFQALRNKAAKTVIIEKEFSIAAYQRRNEFLVDNCDLLVACWNGTPGGTANCVRYAESIGKPIRFLELPGAGA